MLRNNDGVHKLTSFAKYEDGGVSRVKQAMLRKGRHLIMYEVWLADRFERYEFIVVDDDAKIMKGPWSPKVPARMFGFRDEVMMIDGKAVFYDAVGGELRRYTVTEDGTNGGDGGGGMTTAPTPRPTPRPTGPTFETEMLADINHFRCMHGSPIMQWDSQLAEDAQKWAEFIAEQMGKLEPEKRGARHDWSHIGKSGQTGHMGPPSTNFEVVKAWYDEIKHTNNGRMSAYIRDAEYYAQLVWKSSTKLGCGKAHTGDTRWGTIKQEVWDYHHCLYSPEGNWPASQFSSQVPGPQRTEEECGCAGGSAEACAKGQFNYNTVSSVMSTVSPMHDVSASMDSSLDFTVL